MLKNISENINESEERKKLGEKLEEEKKRFVINPAGAEVDQSKLSALVGEAVVETRRKDREEKVQKLKEQHKKLSKKRKKKEKKRRRIGEPTEEEEKKLDVIRDLIENTRKDDQEKTQKFLEEMKQNQAERDLIKKEEWDRRWEEFKKQKKEDTQQLMEFLKNK